VILSGLNLLGGCLVVSKVFWVVARWILRYFTAYYGVVE